MPDDGWSGALSCRRATQVLPLNLVDALLHSLAEDKGGQAGVVLSGAGSDGAVRIGPSRKPCIWRSQPMHACRFLRGRRTMGRVADFVGLWVSLLFQRHKLKKLKRPWNQWQSPKFPLRWRQHRGRAMSGSLLDQCRKSILKIAETQPPDGRRAILMMAEMFRANSDRASSDGRPSLSQDFHASGRPRRLQSASR